MKVEKGIPIPDEKVRYPYEELEVGDSFLVVDESIHNVCNKNVRAGRKLGIRLTARSVTNGVRVWRTA